ncbi:MAG: ArsR family transcriptional regulator [Anaerolineae bacterium]|nr:ArsR family transcriptional regulator [Anaerolineae bacterium]
MHETRAGILQSIQRHRTVTINELAAEIGIVPVTVRHHLYALMGEGLVTREAVRAGVGRPEHRYSLTEQGQRRFPGSYHTLATYLLDAIRCVQSPPTQRRILTGALRDALDLPLPGSDPASPEYLHRLEAHLLAHSIPAHVTPGEDGLYRLELHCPYHVISHQHSDLCEDGDIVRDILQLPLNRASCLQPGDKSCTFSITLAAGQAAVTPSQELTGSQS